MFTLFTDSDCDFTPKDCKKYGFKLISMPYIINDKEVFPYESFDKFNPKEFYDLLRSGVVPKTSGISPEKYISYIEPEFKEGKDVVYVHFSPAMSGTFNALNVALEELKEKYPNRTCHLIDTNGITIASYIICKQIGQMALNGASIEEMKKFVAKEANKYATYIFADDLKFFGRSGRVSNFAAAIGSFVGIRPIISVCEDGKMQSVGKVKGRKKAFNTIVDYVINLGEDITNYPIVIGHTDYLDAVNELIKMLEDRLGKKLNIEIIDVNPTCGCHAGPNALGICFHAKHR